MFMVRRAAAIRSRFQPLDSPHQVDQRQWRTTESAQEASAVRFFARAVAAFFTYLAQFSLSVAPDTSVRRYERI